MARSHFRNHQQNQSIRNSLLGIFGIIVLIVVLFWFGPQLLITFSLLLNKSDKQDITKNTKGVNYVAPPILNPQPTATNSATITISGSVTSGKTVKLYINGKSDKTTIKKDNSFTFSGVKLEKGGNEIKAKVFTKDDQESNYSETLLINYLDKAPALEITFPKDGDTIDHNPITLSGKTDENVKITVNNFWAITNDDGTFSYQFNLQKGDNHIKIIANDEAGNTTEKELTIKHN